MAAICLKLVWPGQRESIYLQLSSNAIFAVGCEELILCISVGWSRSGFENDVFRRDTWMWTVLCVVCTVAQTISKLWDLRYSNIRTSVLLINRVSVLSWWISATSEWPVTAQGRIYSYILIISVQNLFVSSYQLSCILAWLILKSREQNRWNSDE